MAGKIVLYMKTVERAHSPATMWEKIELSNNYARALEQVSCLCIGSILYRSRNQIDEQLLYWPSFTIHKCKQRVTKLTQYLIKARRMALREQLVSDQALDYIQYHFLMVLIDQHW